MPPSYMELRAEQEKKSLGVNVLCANSTRVRVKVDPTITVQEFSSIAFSAASIKDTFGFEIFIEIFDKVSTLSPLICISPPYSEPGFLLIFLSLKLCQWVQGTSLIIYLSARNIHDARV